MRFLLLFIFFAVLLPITNSIQIQLSYGKIEGRKMNATYSPFGYQTANVFFGVPFAQPPLGALRFRKSVEPKAWEGVLETKEYKPACMSNMTRTYKTTGKGPMSEDCLYMNIFTNDFCMSTKNCSVMIVVHGGAYLFESGSAFNPEILINNFVGQNRNIVVAAINYRLGVFGFGHLHGEGKYSAADWNVGLFDVLRAAQFIQSEIHHFGGNKHQVTIAGHSAGAGIINQFSSSPLTKGLVHQQIVMSGPMGQISKTSNFKATTEVAKELGCLPKDTGHGPLANWRVEKVYNCMRKATAQQVLDAQLNVVQNTTFYFGAPQVDGEFVVDYPDHLFASQKIFPINTMIGTTSAEMRESQYIIVEKNWSKKDYLLRNLCDHVAYEIYENPEDFSDRCVKFYNSNGTYDSQYLTDDMEFYWPAINIANAHARNSRKVYMYSYVYTGAGPAFNKYMPTVPSPHHSEDLIYVFGTHRAVMAPKDYVIEKIYSGLFANFVNTGDPSPSKRQKWVEYTPETREYFEVDFDANFTMPGMKHKYYERAVRFWSNEGKKHHRDYWSPSLDTFIMTNLVNPIESHLNSNSTDTEKGLEPMELLYKEREMFLGKLKVMRKVELMKGRGHWKTRSGEAKVEERGDLILVIFAGVLMLGMLYVTISHCCMHYRSREGYELLK